jgi:hypothetical protein
MACENEKQIPLCIPRPPNCGGKENARDSVRDDTFVSFSQALKPRRTKTLHVPRKLSWVRDDATDTWQVEADVKNSPLARYFVFIT